MKIIAFWGILSLTSCFLPTCVTADTLTDDTLVVGNIDGSPITAHPGQRLSIPLWVWCNDSVTFVHTPVATENRYVQSRLGGMFYFPFSLWDDVSFLQPNPIETDTSCTNQSILGFAYTHEPPDRQYWLHTDGIFWRLADFEIVVAPDTTIVEATTCFIDGNHSQNGDLMLADGLTFLDPVRIFGCLSITRLAGDANLSGQTNGIDVTYMVNYFKGSGTPPRPYLAGDANGDCVVNGIDVVYMVNFFKGYGPAPVWAECG
jgi:hypothetical protein